MAACGRYEMVIWIVVENLGCWARISTTDPDFDPKEKAFYYARVIEIPTPRWVLYDKVRLGADLPKDAKLTHQERAYTSPIWYTP